MAAMIRCATSKRWLPRIYSFFFLSHSLSICSVSRCISRFSSDQFSLPMGWNKCAAGGSPYRGKSSVNFPLLIFYDAECASMFAIRAARGCDYDSDGIRFEKSKCTESDCNRFFSGWILEWLGFLFDVQRVRHDIPFNFRSASLGFGLLCFDDETCKCEF